jgi:FkbM family methyltransferase
VSAPTDISHRRPFFEKLSTSVRKRIVGRKPAPGGGRLRRTHYFGARLDVDLEDEVGYEIAISRFEWRELKLMLEACARLRPDVFIDVGANLGLYTCVVGCRSVVPSLIAFEPDRENFTRLAANLALNNLSSRVEAHEAAVGGRAGTASLLPSARDNRGMSRVNAVPGAGSYEVAMVALDDCVSLAEGKIAIKIDVEGFEDEVLNGAQRLLGLNGGYAQIEAHGDAAAARLTARMATLGWRMRDRYGLDVRFEKP